MADIRTATAALACVAALLTITGCDPEKTAQGDSKTGGSGAGSSPTVQPIHKEPVEGEEVAVLDTEKGKIVLMFYPERAPKHVENFKDLVRKGFYDGTRFHRTIPGFMIQGGDPNSKDTEKSETWGMGGYLENGAERNVPAEFNDINHIRGILSMARGNDPNSASSQFFIMHVDSPHLNGQYSAFGRVLSGQEAVDAIVMTPTKDANGTVFPTRAFILKKATIETWPLKE